MSDGEFTRKEEADRITSKTIKSTVLQPSVLKSRTSSTVQKSQQFTLMQSCVECFQHFFNLYTTKRVLQDPSRAEKFLLGITRHNDMGRSTDSDSVLDSASEYSCDDLFPSERDPAPVECQSEGSVDESAVLTYKCACKLLLDFSSFPIYCTEYNTVLKRTLSRGKARLEVRR